MPKVSFILCFNIISFGCSFQLLYNDLLGTVNYSALKQKLISLLIIWIRLMDEYILRLQGKLLEKKLLSVAATYHCKSGLSQHCATK